MVTCMKTPSQRKLEADLADGPFKMGEANKKWGLLEDLEKTWPYALFWVKAGQRQYAPDCFLLNLHVENYPSAGPSGGFWDTESGDVLAAEKWPKGTGQVAAVFRHGWQNGKMLYHPLDGGTLSSHSDWPEKHPSDIWTSEKIVVDYLEMVFSLLHSGDYTGV